MPEVQNVGAVDYAQYQPSQYVDNNYAEEYNTQPEVYDEHAEQMRSASKSRLGETILGLAIVGGLALWGGHAWGKKAAKGEIEKAQEVIKSYEKAQEVIKSYEKTQEALKELDKDANKVIDNDFGGYRFGKDFAKKFKEAFNKLFPKAEEGANNTKKAKEAAEEVKDKAKETGDKAKEAGDKAADDKK